MTATVQNQTAPRRGRVSRGILFNWGSLVIAAVVSFVLTPLMIRGLGQYYYGLWVLAMSVADQYGLLDLGMTAALSRFAGYFQGSKDRAGLNEMFCLTFLLTVMAAGVICVLSGAAAVILPGFFGVAPAVQGTFVRLILLLGLTTAIAFPERMLAAYLRGIQRFDLFNLAATGTTLVRAVLLIVALSSGSGILPVAYITLGMGLVSFVAHYWIVRWADPELKLRFTQLNRKRLRELFGFSIYAFIASLGSRLITRMDSIVIGRVLSVALIAPFNVASRLMDYFVGVFGGIYGPVLSAMSELDGASKRDELRLLFVRSTRYTLLLSLLMGCLTIVDGQEFLRFWLGSSGLDLRLTYKILVLLTFCYTVYQAQLPSRCAIYARARHQLLAGLVLCEGLVNLGLSIYWGRRYGLVGIALGTTVPSVLHNLLVLPYYALRVVDLPFRQYFEGLWRPLLVGTLFALLCRFGAWHSHSIIGLALLALYQLGAFGLLTYALALTADERQQFSKKLRRIAGAR